MDKWKVSKEDMNLHRIPGDGDQRRYYRIQMIIGLVCHRPSQSDVNVITDDVSLGGIRFSSQAKFIQGESVEVEIPMGHGEYRRVRGKVAWGDTGVYSGFEGGIEFSKMDPETEKAWQRFIKENAESQ